MKENVFDAEPDVVNKLVPKAGHFLVAFVGINHIKQVVGSKFFKLETKGGDAWKYYCSVRIMTKKGDFTDEFGDEVDKSMKEPCGLHIEMHQLKTKVCKPNRRLTGCTLNFDHGFDVIPDTVEMCIKYGLIIRNGSWFETITGIEPHFKLQGKVKVVNHLKNTEELLYLLLNEVSSRIEARTITTVLDVANEEENNGI